MELESSKVAKRVLSDPDNTSEQSAPSMATAGNTNQQAVNNNRSSTSRNNKRRVKRQKPRQKWNNNYNHNNNNHTYNANLTHYHQNAEYAQNQLNELNSFGLNNPLNQFNSSLGQLTRLNNLNQNNFQNLNQNSFATLAPLNYQNLNQTNYPPPPPPNLSQPANFQGLNPISGYPAINQNLNQNIPNQKPHQKRYHQFGGNQHYNQPPPHNQHYQHKSNNNNNNSHFNQNNRKIRKDIRKKREQWANRKQIKDGLLNANSNQMENSSTKQPFIKKRLQPAPNNTTSFLMEDHNVRESDLEKFKKLIRKETPKDGLEDTNDENSEQQPKINDRRLHTLNDESSSDEFYSSPDDEQDFMEKQFTEIYDNIHAERLDSMSKTELIHEYLHLESKCSKLEDKLRTENTAQNYQYNSSEQSTTEEEQSNLNAIAVESGNPADRTDKTDVETTEEYTNSSLSVNNRNQQSPSQQPQQQQQPPPPVVEQPVVINRETVQQQPNKISLEQLQNEIKRLMKENSSLRRENEFLKRSNYNSNNESVLESDDQAKRMVGGKPNEFGERPSQLNQGEQDQSSDDNGESSSDSEEDESLDSEESSDFDEENSSELNGDMNGDEMNGEMNGLNGLNGDRVDDNRRPQIEEENANLNSALEQRSEDAEMQSNEN